MKETSNFIKRVFFNNIANPRPFCNFIIGAVIILTLKLVFDVVILSVPWSFVILFVASRIVEAVGIKQISNNFALYRFFGCSYIFQNKKIRKTNCRETLLEIKADQECLADRIPSGKYITLTHDTVLQILRESSRVNIIYEKEAFIADLKHVQNVLFNCRKCDVQMCLIRSTGKLKRQFYCVKFTKLDSDID